MIKRGYIVLGDPLSNGGTVTGASGPLLNNNPALKMALLGDTVVCALHGSGTITQGHPSVTANEKPIALEGYEVSCKCKLEALYAKDKYFVVEQEGFLIDIAQQVIEFVSKIFNENKTLQEIDRKIIEAANTLPNIVKRLKDFYCENDFSLFKKSKQKSKNIYLDMLIGVGEEYLCSDHEKRLKNYDSNLESANNTNPNQQPQTLSNGKTLALPPAKSKLNKPIIYENSGKKGNWNKELNSPNANTIYIVDNKYRFETDNLGRTVSVETDLDLVKGKDRNGYQQITAAKKGKLDPYTKKKMDQGGHIIANRFGGPGEKINLVPQDAEKNLGGGAWNETEQRWASELKKGNKVKVKIELHYSGDSPRPDAFSIKDTFTDPNGKLIKKSNFLIQN